MTVSLELFENTGNRLFSFSFSNRPHGFPMTCYLNKIVTFNILYLNYSSDCQDCSVVPEPRHRQGTQHSCTLFKMTLTHKSPQNFIKQHFANLSGSLVDLFSLL